MGNNSTKIAHFQDEPWVISTAGASAARAFALRRKRRTIVARPRSGQTAGRQDDLQRSRLPKVASLVKEIDRVIQETPDNRVGSYVNFLGEDFERRKTAAADFGENHKINHVALVVPGGSIDGPKRMRIHPDAQVTVIIYQMKPDKMVKANHAFTKDNLNAEGVAAVISDIEKHLK